MPTRARAAAFALAALIATACTADPPPAAAPSASPSPTATTTATATPSAARPSLPVLPSREPVATCDSGGNTLEMAACAEAELVAAEAEVNRLTAAVWRLRHDDEGRALVVAAHEAFVAYADAACQADSDAARGGSIRGMEYAACRTFVTRQRAALLRAELAAAREG